MKQLLLLPILLLVFYGMYWRGLLVLQSKRAVSFVGSARCNRATFTSCTGKVQRKIRFREERECAVTLSANLEKGTLEVELLQGKTRIFLLRENGERITFTPKRGISYTLMFRFQSATGNYCLQWD